MPFEFRQILDVGTSNPIVARLGPQTCDLLDWIDLPKDKVDAMKDLYVITLTQRLVACEKIGSDIVQQLIEQVDRAKRLLTRVHAWHRT